MRIAFFCPQWGMEALPLNQFLMRVKSAGFDGVEMMVPLDTRQRELLSSLLRELKLLLIVQNWQPYTTNLGQYLMDFKQRLVLSAQFEPVLINSHTGRDLFSFDQNKEAIEVARGISQEYGIRILHETHRGRFAYSGPATMPYFRTFPDLHITADFSHWCCVSESYLEDQPEVLNEAIGRARHIHARIGYPGGPQITDPRAPEWSFAVNTFLGWWDRIVETNVQRGNNLLTITPEFGPPPYMHTLPFSDRPVVDQFKVNDYMKNILTERYIQYRTLSGRI
jgi:sugar phosphate isomerase/epimerase